MAVALGAVSGTTSTAATTALAGSRARRSCSRFGAAASEHPALAPLVELQLLEALPPPGLAQPQVELSHVGVAAQGGGRTVEDDPAVLHDVAGVGDGQRDLGVLLHEQGGGAPLGVDLLDDREDLAHQQGRAT